MIDFKIDGHATDKINRLRRAIDRTIADGLDAVGQRVSENARLYLEHRRKTSATAPVTGPSVLADSIDYTVVQNSVMIGTPVPYAIYVELGTFRQSARPFLMPALDDVRAEVIGIIGQHIRMGMEGLLS